MCEYKATKRTLPAAKTQPFKNLGRCRASLENKPNSVVLQFAGRKCNRRWDDLIQWVTYRTLPEIARHVAERAQSMSESDSAGRNVYWKRQRIRQEPCGNEIVEFLNQG